MIKNAFFNLALKKAASLLGRKTRMVALLGQFVYKLKDVQWNQLKSNDIKEKLFVIGRLFKAYTLGHYRSIPWKPLLLITATMIYFVSPIDFIPDVLAGIGFTDDFAILLAVYNSVNAELDKFISWEQTRVIEL